MEVLLVLIPVSIALAAASVVACLVAIRAGQYDDMESPRWRMLFDPPGSTAKVNQQVPRQGEMSTQSDGSKKTETEMKTKSETKMRRSTPT
jgi:cbb3-type cytochrome oxidase maturation protein